MYKMNIHFGNREDWLLAFEQTSDTCDFNMIVGALIIQILLSGVILLRECVLLHNISAKLLIDYYLPY